MTNSIGRRWPWLPLLLLLLLLGCYPGEDFTVDELDTVITNYNEEEDYGQFLTFAVPDSVVRVGDDGTQEPGPFDEIMLDLVRSNMLELGYQEAIDPENNTPDLVVLVELAVVDNTVISPCYPVWPGWGWWYWPPGWGPGWCGGLPWVPVGQYTTGTVILSMIDVDGADAQEEVIPIIWSGLINGLVTGSEASLEARIRTNINQAFDQSPYLGR